MSSAAAAADAPEEFAALADYTIDDFMSEAASDVPRSAATITHGLNDEGSGSDKLR